MKAIFVGIALIMLCGLAKAELLPVYVLSIGSGDYGQSVENGYFSFGSNEAAYLGARRVAQTFVENGARRVIQVLGRDGERVSRDDILGPIEELATLAKQEKAADPLLVVYVSAHGLSDNFGHNLFIMPGNLAIREEMLDRSGPLMRLVDTEGLEAVAPTALEVFDALERTGVDFLLFIDTCFETTVELDLDALRRIDAQAASLASDVSNIIRFISLPRGPHPIVFSAPPGSMARPAPDPLGSGSDYIAPLARRIVLAAQKARSKGTLGRQQLLDDLTQANFDPETEPGVTWYEGVRDAREIFHAGGSGGVLEKRRGASNDVLTCCGSSTTPVTGSATDTSWTVSGVVAFSGDADDYVSAGKAVNQRINTSVQTVWSVEAAAFEIDLQLKDGQEISISVAASDTNFEPRLYSGAVRAAFVEQGQAGLSVTMDGNGCNEIEGWFRVIDAEYTASGALRRLHFDFEQICDGGPGALRGSANLSFEQDATATR